MEGSPSWKESQKIGRMIDRYQAHVRTLPVTVIRILFNERRIHGYPEFSRWVRKIERGILSFERATRFNVLVGYG